VTQSSIETTSTLNGLYKEVYADRINDLVPESDVLLNMDNFVSKEQREGNKYHQPVILALPTGATWGVGVVTLTNAIASQMGDAQVQGSAITHRDLLAYDAAAKAAQGGKQSFAEATSLIVKNLVKATSKFLELDLLYGGGSSPAAGNSLAQQTTNTTGTPSSTQTVVTISYATWASAIFSGMENAQVVFYNAGSLVSSGVDSIFTIASINVVPASATVGGTLTVNGTTTGTTALQALSSTTLDIYWNTSYGNQMLGLRGILATSSGTLFNINMSNYSLWQSNSYDVASTQLTFGKLQAAIALGVNRGLDSDSMTLVSPSTFANLVDEQAGARMYDSSYKGEKGENGFKKLQFFGPNGVNTIMVHIFCHQGEAYIVSEEELVRMGPVENVTNTLPGMPGDFFVQSQTYAAYELRCYANQAIFLEFPAHGVILKNIVNV
jgi:hypothetical protein